MQAFLAQAQLLLTALGAVLPLVPDARQAEVGAILRALAAALTLAAHVETDIAALAAKLKALRAEIEAVGDGPMPAEAIEAAFARVRAASAALHAAAA
jgi:hypothetical protein